jgi:hypothetical protein
MIETTHPDPIRVTDIDGNLREELAGWTQFSWRAEVTEYGDGRWLIWDLGEWEQ